MVSIFSHLSGVHNWESEYFVELFNQLVKPQMFSDKCVYMRRYLNCDHGLILEENILALDSAV